MTLISVTPAFFIGKIPNFCLISRKCHLNTQMNRKTFQLFYPILYLLHIRFLSQLSNPFSFEYNWFHWVWSCWIFSNAIAIQVAAARLPYFIRGTQILLSRSPQALCLTFEFSGRYKAVYKDVCRPKLQNDMITLNQDSPISALNVSNTVSSPHMLLHACSYSRYVLNILNILTKHHYLAYGVY